MAIEALVFDFDGLVLDTEGPDYRSWHEIHREHGCDLPLETWTVCIGSTTHDFDPCAHLEERLGRPVDRPTVRAARRARFMEMVAAEAIRPGLEAYLDGARQRSLKLGVASSADCGWVTGNLTRLGLLERFDAVRCAGHVTRTKPDPELYLAALQAIDVPPSRAIAFEDTPIGVLAAKRAGLFAVAVPHALTGHLPFDHADLRLESLADLPLEDLLAVAERRLSGDVAR